MMKKNKYLIFGILAFFMISSCDTLDIENIYDYNADLVWDDESLVEAYMANVYADVMGNWSATLDQKTQQLSGIHFYLDRVTITNTQYKEWNYETIRLINEAIVNVDAGTLDQEVKDDVIGQAKFLRAYVYFNMVRYHGGVPYITVPQNKDTDDLYVKRNSTAECFDFIIKDLDEAISLLPEQISKSSKEFGKIDGCFAIAFKAKVLLYKASPQFNPSNPWDNNYWKEAHTANETAYTKLKSLGYALTPQYEDIFLVERGPEVVFSVINTYPNKTINWDYGVRPGSESRGPASACPTWEFVKEFPMKDGKLYDDPTGTYHKTDEEFLQSYWENRDPRFDKSIIWNGSVYEVSNKSGNRQYTALGIADVLDDFGVNPAAKTNSTNLDRYSGFFVRKASDLSLLQSEVQQYDIDFIVMRFAEVMLNYAETANETGKSDVALSILKEIRERAGIEAGNDGNYGITATTREQIRAAIVAERNIEFCFEDMRFWNLRRLRMLDVLDGTTKHGVEAIAINPDGSEMAIAVAEEKAANNELTEEDFKYTTLQIPFTGVKVNSVPEKYYFFPIQQEVIDLNSNIEQNVDWGGTFDPTL
ncbi:RagB/SusD family nutrient uptake outer membrane protein [Sunxiuqinia elliptica]|uniref:Putative outer membrane starch-binding protein n=1 Tax=Sunxiuqinia elliptica TaxID=655355 RepID=A0A4R6H974_9BACT|nr:RagB/SusD family nutrient uptake outer membrane protein [Sunxiuqinia elliptica]TDO05013.1 putative outer membrane starch-binding protein [Sunxiuqinia elliptica]TDO64562.1 putative outer membrane starch-binding protein [Sunxiuqinia elliptica]